MIDVKIHKAPFGRMGGKSKLAKTLIKMFPKNYDTYVEPFVGAGNVYFRIPYKVSKEVINDLDDDVYIVMNGLKTDSKHINDNIKRQFDKEYFMSILKSKDVVHIMERIKRSIFSMGKGYSKPRHDKDRIATDFLPYGERLKDTIITNKSFEILIQENDSPTSFFYLDPPYESENKKDYKHNDVEPIDVYNAIKDIKGKFMISYNYSENVKEVFKEYNLYTVKTKYAQTKYIKARNIKELVITNYKI
jgi:DNA adenine methylase